MGRTLHSLNGMRGVAAVLVMALHFGGFAPKGYLAVDLFFLLSGVVVASAYEARIETGMTTMAFMRLRFIRLYPLYLLGTLACLATGAAHGPITLPLLAFALLMLPFSSAWGSLYPAMGVAWSLMFELVANLGFAAFHRHLSSTRLAIVALAGFVGMLFALGWLGWLGSLDGGARWSTWWVGLARVAFAFPLGVLIWRHRTRLTFALPPIITLPVIAIVCIGWDEQAPLFDLVAVVLVWPILVIGGCNSTASARWLGWLGAISYPIYCLHYAVAIGPLAPTTPAMATGYGIAVIAVAWLVDRYYDQPVRTWLARRTPPGGQRVSLP